MQTAIPCLFIRGGTSRGLYFLEADLPENKAVKEKILLSAMGSPDEGQIDGVGGSRSVTSKVAILSPSDHPWADVDYLFAQVQINRPSVDWAPSCGNILAGVAPAAIEKGLVLPQDGETKVKIRAVNTGSLIEAVVRTPGGKVAYEGEMSIDGVPGTAAPILLKLMEVVGSKTGKLLPTNHRREKIDGVEVTCIDVAMPMVIAPAQNLGKTGYETKAELDADQDFLERLERIRRIAGERMGLGNVANSVIPKFAIIAPPRYGGNLTSRYFVPDSCHPTHAMTGAICVASCSILKGSVAEGFALVSGSRRETVVIEHPVGKIEVILVRSSEEPTSLVESAVIIRTARLLFSGYVHVPIPCQQ